MGLQELVSKDEGVPQDGEEETGPVTTGIELADILEICDQMKEDLRKEFVSKINFDTLNDNVV